MGVTSFILHSILGLGLDYTISLWIAAFVTLAAAVAYIRAIYKDIRGAVAPMA